MGCNVFFSSPFEHFGFVSFTHLKLSHIIGCSGFLFFFSTQYFSLENFIEISLSLRSAVLGLGMQSVTEFIILIASIEIL